MRKRECGRAGAAVLPGTHEPSSHASHRPRWVRIPVHGDADPRMLNCYHHHQPLATTDPLPSPLPSSRLASAMTEKLDSPAVNSGRPYVVLPPTLAQLVEDRFDEDQYEQAVLSSSRS